MRRTPLVTLTTDIGWAYAAQMKAVLARRAPNARVVDIAHDVPPQGIREAAFLLGHIAPQFPPGTIHVAVVDPGVGGQRAPMAVRTSDGSFLIGPDNGVLSLACDALGGGTAVRLDAGTLVRSGRPSATFEGRDVFAPAAAALASGRPFARLGPVHELRRLTLPVPKRRATTISGEVVHVDVFGNAITNIPTADLPAGVARVSLRLGRFRASAVPVWRTYEDGPLGALGVLGSSFGYLEVASRNRSAARRARIAPGARVTVGWSARGGARK
ncbi:MAG TPA: SAM-dependent chlorinase/fluorinase [Thermoplasmata archaeon]|nr:SAM-dependent chlorinase/fluorinase [Thermoplasmata archaeon]